MRTKAEILKDLGFSSEYQLHGGIPADTKEVIVAEILIDLRDIFFSQLNEDQKRVFKLHQLP